MNNFFIWLATLGGVIVVALGVANWASRKSAALRNCATFVLAAGASYCVSFVVDIWAQTALGNIPPGNVVLPSITWLVFASALGAAAFLTGGSAYAIWLPFALNAVLALVVSSVHPQNLTVGLVLLLLAVIVTLVQRVARRLP